MGRVVRKLGHRDTPGFRRTVTVRWLQVMEPEAR